MSVVATGVQAGIEDTRACEGLQRSHFVAHAPVLP
jgi:hypothetical protein